MKILMIAQNDPAGSAIAFTQAINDLTCHSCRLITLETRYRHNWKKDIHIPDIDNNNMEIIKELLTTSDIFHFHMTADEYLKIGPFLPRDFLKNKNIVHHHHGHPDFRTNADKYRQKYKKLHRGHLLVSTPDLLKLLPEAKWLPNLVPQAACNMKAVCNTKKEKDTVTISHSPTRQELKNTDNLLLAIKQLQKKGLNLKLDLIDNIPHKDCLIRKQKSDIVFDHMQGYYGISSLESLAMGIPTVAGLSNHCIQHIKNFTKSDSLPWITAYCEQELKQTLSILTADKDLRHQIGKESKHFMQKYWNQDQIIKELCTFYETM